MRKATKNPKDLKIPFSIGISPSLAEDIDRRAMALERSRSWLAEKLLARGIAAYMRDGQFDEPGAEDAILNTPSSPVVEQDHFLMSDPKGADPKKARKSSLIRKDIADAKARAREIKSRQ